MDNCRRFHKSSTKLKKLTYQTSNDPTRSLIASNRVFPAEQLNATN